MYIRESFDIYFELVENPRSQAHITYRLSDILFILVTGMLCSCTDFEMIIEFVEEKKEFKVAFTFSLDDKKYLQKIYKNVLTNNSNHVKIKMPSKSGT